MGTRRDVKPNDVWMKRLRGGIRVSLSGPDHQNLAQSTVSPEPLSSPMDGYGGCVYRADDQDDFETERVGCCREDVRKRCMKEATKGTNVQRKGDLAANFPSAILP